MIDKAPNSEGCANQADGSVTVVIPAFNEEKTIADVIHRVRQYVPEARILVIDDGSSDATALEAARRELTLFRTL